MLKKHIFFILCLISIFWCQVVFAYDDKSTHPDIAYFAVKKSILKTNKFLSTNFGNDFVDEEETMIRGKQIIKWITSGATAEDNPDCRAQNHFLNPLKVWNEAALSDMENTFLGAGINAYCFIIAPFDLRYSMLAYSNVTWATGHVSPTSGATNESNNMNWNVIRQHYKDALTKTYKNNRNKFFTKTFQGLGQMTHLIQDMAVPAHVRNDFTATFIREES